MRKFGIIGLLLIGFTAGVFFVYSCGGSGGSTAVAGGDADTLGGFPPEYFASSAQLEAAMPGAYPITPLDFSNTLFEIGAAPVLAGGLYSNSIYAPVALPFRCVIHSIAMLAMDNDASNEMEAHLYRGGNDLFTLASGTGSASADTQYFVTLASPGTDFDHDPASGDPLYMRVDFSDYNNNLQVYWLKINYSIPVL
jgi:hypothetical protein